MLYLCRAVWLFPVGNGNKKCAQKTMINLHLNNYYQMSEYTKGIGFMR
jgi:hypothetical protein